MPLSAVPRTASRRRSSQQKYSGLGRLRSCGRDSFRELGGLQGLRSPNEIADGDAQNGIFVRHIDRIDLDQIAEVLLERALHEVLGGGGEFVAVRRKNQTKQAAPEVRTVDPFARRGEEHLLDQVADVRVVSRPRPSGRARRSDMGNRCSCGHDARLRGEDEQALSGRDADGLAGLRDDRHAARKDTRRADDPLCADAWRCRRCWPSAQPATT